MKKCVVCGERFKIYGILKPNIDSWRGIFFDINDSSRCKSCGSVNVWQISVASAFLLNVVAWIGYLGFYFFLARFLPFKDGAQTYNMLLIGLSLVLFGLLYSNVNRFVSYVYRFFFATASESIDGQSNNSF